MSTASSMDTRKKSRSAPLIKKKSNKAVDSKKSKKVSQSSIRQSDSASMDPSVLKYVLDYGRYVCKNGRTKCQ